MTAEADGQINSFNMVVLGNLSRNRGADPRRVGGGVRSCVGRVIRVENLVVRKDALERFLVACQQLGFLEEKNVILLCKFGQCFVYVLMVGGVVGE